MNVRRTLLALAGLALLGGPALRADEPYLYGGQNLQYYFPLGGGRVEFYGTGDYWARELFYEFDRVPYYSKHPPVYYSYPVPRPYGWSPDAYPGSTETPHLQMRTVPAEPMNNPHVEPNGDAEPMTQTRARRPRPRVIYNPFVEQTSERVAASQSPVSQQP
jgi:hypothetical protein